MHGCNGILGQNLNVPFFVGFLYNLNAIRSICIISYDKCVLFGVAVRSTTRQPLIGFNQYVFFILFVLDEAF